MTDDNGLIEELEELGNHPCRVDLPFGATIRQAAAELRRLSSECEAMEGALRIAIWNACRASNMKQDAAIQAVEKKIAEVKRLTPTNTGDAP